MKSKREKCTFSQCIFAIFALKKGFYTSKQIFTSKHAMCLRRQQFPDEIIKTCLMHNNYLKLTLSNSTTRFYYVQIIVFLCLMLK